jgi:hypothetical protein
MSKIQVDSIANKEDNGSPDFPFGLTGNVTGNVNGDITAGIITANDLRLSSIADKTTIVSGNTVSLVYNTGGAGLQYPQFTGTLIGVPSLEPLSGYFAGGGGGGVCA